MKIFLAQSNFLGRNEKRKYKLLREREQMFYFPTILFLLKLGRPEKYTNIS
jgi:hypothetical protein